MPYTEQDVLDILCIDPLQQQKKLMGWGIMKSKPGFVPGETLADCAYRLRDNTMKGQGWMHVCKQIAKLLDPNEDLPIAWVLFEKAGPIHVIAIAMLVNLNRKML